MSSALITDLLGVLDELSGGIHAGFRPAHAKGLMCNGSFSPTPDAAGESRRVEAPGRCPTSQPLFASASERTGYDAFRTVQ